MGINQSFVIDIKDTQNHTWQGKICWVQKQKEVPFRSVLEMVELMQSAIKSKEQDEKLREEE